MKGLKPKWSYSKTCKKRRFPSKIDAKMAMADIMARDSTSRSHQEKRIYFCPKCKGYHLTSKQR